MNLNKTQVYFKHIFKSRDFAKRFITMLLISLCQETLVHVLVAILESNPSF